MTCVAFHKNKVYADSCVIKDGEMFQSMTKIQGFLMPPAVKCEKPGFVIDDVFYGWSGTGGFPAMEKFAERLEELGRRKEEERDYDGCFSFYAVAASQNLVVDQGNLFEIVFVGEKANHMFRFNSREEFAKLPLWKPDSDDGRCHCDVMPRRLLGFSRCWKELRDQDALLERIGNPHLAQRFLEVT